MRSLRVMMLEGQTGAGDLAAAALERSGHEVVRCFEPGGHAHLCNAVAGDGCPLRSQPIDVALTVRHQPTIRPTALEQGITCALQRHIPVVVAGMTLLHPFATGEHDVVECSADAVVATCERVASAPLGPHGRAATAALQAFCAQHGVSTNADAEVLRERDRLVVAAHAAQLPSSLHGMAAVRVLSALRELDPDARGIDVAFPDA
jgi:hypothetical protein